MKYEFEDHCWKDLMDENVLNIYKAYEREIFVGKKTALLAIDLYNLADEVLGHLNPSSVEQPV